MAYLTPETRMTRAYSHFDMGDAAGSLAGGCPASVSRSSRKNSATIFREITRNNFVDQRMPERIMCGWSPQQISGRMRLERHPVSVSHATAPTSIARPNRAQHLGSTLLTSQPTRSARSCRDRARGGSWRQSRKHRSDDPGTGQLERRQDNSGAQCLHGIDAAGALSSAHRTSRCTASPVGTRSR